MKFCPNCGAQAADDAIVCGQCGTPFAPQAQGNSFAPAQAGIKKLLANKKLLMIIGGAILAVIVAIILIVALGGRSVDSVISKGVDAVMENDPEAFLDLFDPNALVVASEEEAKQRAETQVKQLRSFLSQYYGEDFEISYEIKEEKDWEDSKIEKMNKDIEQMEQMYEALKEKGYGGEELNGDFDEYDAGKDVTVEFTVEGNGRTDKKEYKIELVKVGSSWYIQDLPRFN